MPYQFCSTGCREDDAYEQKRDKAFVYLMGAIEGESANYNLADLRYSLEQLTGGLTDDQKAKLKEHKQELKQIEADLKHGAEAIEDLWDNMAGRN